MLEGGPISEAARDIMAMIMVMATATIQASMGAILGATMNTEGMVDGTAIIEGATIEIITTTAGSLVIERDLPAPGTRKALAQPRLGVAILAGEVAILVVADTEAGVMEGAEVIGRVF